jgi:hypothetical protein
MHESRCQVLWQLARQTGSDYGVPKQLISSDFTLSTLLSEKTLVSPGPTGLVRIGRSHGKLIGTVRIERPVFGRGHCLHLRLGPNELARRHFLPGLLGKVCRMGQFSVQSSARSARCRLGRHHCLRTAEWNPTLEFRTVRADGMSDCVGLIYVCVAWGDLKHAQGLRFLGGDLNSSTNIPSESSPTQPRAEGAGMMFCGDQSVNGCRRRRGHKGRDGK